MSDLILTKEMAKVLDIDFVEQFGQSMAQLSDVLGLGSFETMAAGTQLKQYKMSIEGGLKKQGAEGEQIPLTKVKQTAVDKIGRAHV